jgi:hypothetical protein
MEHKETIKIYPYCTILAQDSSYRIVRLNVVTKRFEVLPSIYLVKDDCISETDSLNQESGPVDFILEEEE